MPTIPARLLARFERSPDQIAFYVHKRDDLDGRGLPHPDHPDWRSHTWAATTAEISAIAVELDKLGVGKGTPVAILAETSMTWCALDQATLCLGGITVGIYPSLLADGVKHQLAHAEVQVLLVEDEAQARKVLPFVEELPHLRRVLSIRPTQSCPRLIPGPPNLDLLRSRAATVQPDDIATIVYTSGTTGLPKGVVLTHRNFISIVQSAHQTLPTHPGDRSIIFLPMAHVLQRFATYVGLTNDLEGWFCSPISALPRVLVVARPHVLATVPRMLEKIKSTAELKAAEKGKLAAKILAWAVAVGTKRNHRLRAGQPVPRSLRIKHWVANRLVFVKIRARLGGCLRQFVSGGAALGVDVAEFFEAVGIQVREGWGLSETCAPASSNGEADFKLGTVGRALPGVEIKLASDGELLVKGPGNFSRYHKDPEATAEAHTTDGFFKTGDIGEIDDEGFIRIIDRKKELIVTAGGKNIPPVNIEKRLEGGIVDQAVVIGSERPYLVALLTVNAEQAAGLDAAELEAQVAAHVAKTNASLPRHETVKRFSILPAPLSIEHGELTPTMKLKRRAILVRHAARISAMYA